MLMIITWFGLGLGTALFYLLTCVHCTYIGVSITVRDVLAMVALFLLGMFSVAFMIGVCIIVAIPDSEKLNRFLDKTVIKGK